MKNKKIIITAVTLVLMVFLFCQCLTGLRTEELDPRGQAYTGSQSCRTCHKDIYETHAHNAHAMASQPRQPIDIKTIRDSFLFDPANFVVVEKEDSGLVQTHFVDGKKIASHNADIVFGAGVHAYTFGYWQDKKLFQLPLSYFRSIDSWANSPGFPAHIANFKRAIITRCFECHSSFVAEDNDQTGSITAARNLDRASVIYGIDCERCHGPAGKHVQYHQAHPDEKTGKDITRWTSLDRAQKLDACGVCHSGNDLATQQSTFGFRPGDTLANFYYPSFAATPQADVHGNQVQLLQQSRCYRMSAMDCGTCHSPHRPAPSAEAYSKKCASCHTNVTHKTLPDNTQSLLSSKCLDCHMPYQNSKAISFLTRGGASPTPYRLRTHDIAVYAEESKEIITRMLSSHETNAK